jgi:ribonucleoside-diphosphate reductase alpha chain
MGVMRIDHPDIEDFIEAKTNLTAFTQFNLSVAITDIFMQSVKNDTEFELCYNGKAYKRVNARYLWDKLMRATWDWAEPGVLFIDRINEMNNLWYCEQITATNPCGEQPLPPYGACLLGSFNLVKYIVEYQNKRFKFDWDAFSEDIAVVIRAQDNVVDKTVYPLPQQEAEAKAKRRMGIGYTGLANAGEVLGYIYGSPEFLRFHEKVAKTLTNECYKASSMLAKEKGAFPLFDVEKYMQGKFIKKLDKEVQDLIKENGIRNSHLTSIAPTGTISLGADNVSSGCEPVFSMFYDRTIIDNEGEKQVERVSDYGYRVWGVTPKTADECTTDEHLDVLIIASKWVDSAVSKTLNVGNNVNWENFKEIYIKAWESGCKGCTTFRASGERYGVLNKVEEEAACYYNPETGKKTCE